MNNDIYFDENFKECFHNAIKRGCFNSLENWMYMDSDSYFDYFKHSITRQNKKVKK